MSAEEIGEVAVFSALADDERERLSRAAADIALVPGEYAAHEGDERAIFAVLGGRIEAVKTVDGVERVIGERLPGDVFGEVPIVLGTVFPVGFRAAEKSRVMRIEPHDYHSIAAVVPDVGKEIGKLAGHRISGSHGLEALAADPPPPRAIVVGRSTSAAPRRARRLSSSRAASSSSSGRMPRRPDFRPSPRPPRLRAHRPRDALGGTLDP
ncbi:MAG TPA: cyclic nucleotide-binding domain-containing protein [Solirubrobacterales bacterium]|nr:cyclic nucleotide-binding domain-containing protein [Solirubrobacterales bacterium]